MSARNWMTFYVYRSGSATVIDASAAAEQTDSEYPTSFPRVDMLRFVGNRPISCSSVGFATDIGGTFIRWNPESGFARIGRSGTSGSGKWLTLVER